jgi:hypothetical protein
MVVDGQERRLSISVVVKEEGGLWKVAQTTRTPAAVSVETSVSLEKGTLIVRHMSFNLNQVPKISAVLDFDGGKASGKYSVGGEEQPEALEFGEVGELFPDSEAEWSAVFGCLPLAEGYSTTFRNFSFLSQKVQSMELKVVGVETVTVPAGKFETWKVAIASADGLDHTTLWVAKESRATVKWSSVAMAAGSSATETAELMP